MKKKYPAIRFAGVYSPPFGFEKDPEERRKIIRIVNKAAPDIMICGMGSPKTEIFLMEIMDSLHVSVSMSVGAAIDFLAGTVQRCPAWVSRIGFEWFYRFLKEPKRLFRRYFIEDPVFLLLALKYRPKNRRKR